MTTLTTHTAVATALTGQNVDSHAVRKALSGAKTPVSVAQKNVSDAKIPSAIAPEAVAGPVMTIRLGLTPATIVLFSAPLTVALVMAVAWVLLTSVGYPVYAHEMTAGAIVSAVGGMFASIPLFVLMGKGAQMIAKAGIMSIAVRCSMVLFGMILAMQPAWGLAKMPFVYWVLGFYFPMLMVETGLVAWLSVKAKF